MFRECSLRDGILNFYRYIFNVDPAFNYNAATLLVVVADVYGVGIIVGTLQFQKNELVIDWWSGVGTMAHPTTSYLFIAFIRRAIRR